MSGPIKASAIICALVMVLFCLAPSVYATPNVLRPLDYVDSSTTDNGVISYTFRFMQTPFYQLYDVDTFVRSEYGNFTWVTNSSSAYYRISMSPLGNTTFDSNANCMIDVRDFKVNSILELYVTVQFYVEISSGGSSDLTFNTKTSTTLYWFDSNFNLLTTTKPGAVERTVGWGSNVGVWLLQNNFDIEIPEGACYLVPRYAATIYKPADGGITRIQSTDYEYFDVHVKKEAIKEDSVLLERIDSQLSDLNDKVDDTNNKLDDANDKLDDTNDKLDQIINQPEQEKQEASGAGGDAADQLASAIPDYSQGFLPGLGDLAASMAYTGTEAKLTFPAIVLPEIPGIMDSYKLSEKQEIDLGAWVQKMPANLLRLVQDICTIGLVVYSFKELYSMIQFAMALKEGGFFD